MAIAGAIGAERSDVASLRRPGLEVYLDLLHDLNEARGSRVEALVLGAESPIRLYLYVDGDLVDATHQDDRTYEYRMGEIEEGPHIVTARVIDARGRWGGASSVVRSPSP